jgi:hypothetical protein
MVSDREKLRLIQDTRSGKLPILKVPSPLPIEPEFAEFAQFPLENMDFQWNPDGTLSKIIVDNAEAVTEYSFVWNSNQTLSRVIKNKK